MVWYGLGMMCALGSCVVTRMTQQITHNCRTITVYRETVIQCLNHRQALMNFDRRPNLLQIDWFAKILVENGQTISANLTQKSIDHAINPRTKKRSCATTHFCIRFGRAARAEFLFLKGRSFPRKMIVSPDLRAATQTPTFPGSL